MDPDSLDWIWEDFNLTNPTEVTEEPDVDDFVFNDCNDNESDTSSGSIISCPLLIGDQKTDLELKKIVIDIEKRYEKGDVENYVESGSINADVEDEVNDHDSVNKFYNDALEAVKNQLSDVRLVWADTLYECTANERNVPESYKKTTSIEKLVLSYASNFIEQFKLKYPDRRQLVLVHKNECGIQKCICTTIKPTRLVYQDLNDLTSYSEFVSKHITYTKLEDPLTVPKNIVSPTMTLEMQTANCFEISTLLVSFLIGCGYNAFAVHGYATESVCNNDLRVVKLDLPKDNFESERRAECDITEDIIDDCNTPEPTIDLCSEYVKFLLEEERNKAAVENEVKADNLCCSSDSLRGRRVHSWVIVIPLEVENITKNAYFIEPSTGERKDISSENYIGIEAIWNHTNYWVNLQPLDGCCAQYNFSLTDSKCWERFLPSEPQSLHGRTLNLNYNENEIPRILDMPNSWVKILEVPRNKYLLLYPTGKKIISYANALKEFYAEYIMPDGLIERTTFYAEPDYVNKIFVKEVYKHRIDKLISVEIKYTVKGIETMEYFSSGRADCMQAHKFCGDGNNILCERLVTFNSLRLDSMFELKIDANSIATLFRDRSDLLFWRKCVFQKKEESNFQNLNLKRKPKSIVEKYLRDESKHKDRDVASVHFDFESNEIYVQYQYGEGQITQSSRLFKRFTTSFDDFDPESVIENIVYPYVGHLKPHEAYRTLQDMMKAESEALRAVSKLEDEIIKILEIRSREQLEFKLKIDSLDWDRNYTSRQLLQHEKDKKIALAKRDRGKQIDRALPYFQTAQRPFTYDTANEVRDGIIRDFRKNTKNQFLRTRELFFEKKSKLQNTMEALADFDEFKDLELKRKTLFLCLTWKNELDVLMLKMERYKETRLKRYNNLASYLNSNPDFKMLPQLKYC